MQVADQRGVYNNVCFGILESKFSAIVTNFTLICYGLSTFQIFLKTLTSFVAKFFNSWMLDYRMLIV